VIHRQDCEALVSGSTSPVTVTGVRADVLLAEGTLTQAADLRKSKSHSLGEHATSHATIDTTTRSRSYMYDTCLCGCWNVYVPDTFVPSPLRWVLT
jgi:hypothetical protein